jgi:hypothetical protein
MKKERNKTPRKVGFPIERNRRRPTDLLSAFDCEVNALMEVLPSFDAGDLIGVRESGGAQVLERFLSFGTQHGMRV